MSRVRIPADIDREDRIVAGMTARQLAVLGVTGVVLYGGWVALRPVVPVLVYLALAVPIGVVVAALVLLRRDGLSLDRLTAAGLRQRLQPRRRVPGPPDTEPAPTWLAEAAHGRQPAPAGRLELPARGVSEAGVVDLGEDGLALIGACSTVNLSLRTPTEQDALTGVFGRYLHSLTAPVQILVRAQRLDLSDQITQLREHAASLPHPALEAAARDHADYLSDLAAQTDLLRRQVLLIVREPPASSDGLYRAATARLVRRMQEATELLAPAGITVTPLDAAQASAVLAAATRPDDPHPPPSQTAGPDEVITSTTSPDRDQEVP